MSHGALAEIDTQASAGTSDQLILAPGGGSAGFSTNASSKPVALTLLGDSAHRRKVVTVTTTGFRSGSDSVSFAGSGLVIRHRGAATTLTIELAVSGARTVPATFLTGRVQLPANATARIASVDWASLGTSPLRLNVGARTACAPQPPSATAATVDRLASGQAGSRTSSGAHCSPRTAAAARDYPALVAVDAAAPRAGNHHRHAARRRAHPLGDLRGRRAARRQLPGNRNGYRAAHQWDRPGRLTAGQPRAHDDPMIASAVPAAVRLRLEAAAGAAACRGASVRLAHRSLTASALSNRGRARARPGTGHQRLPSSRPGPSRTPATPLAGTASWGAFATDPAAPRRSRRERRARLS